VDLRNAGFKLAPVDTNLFPAGFNNLNPDFWPLCVQAVQNTLGELCSRAKRILLIPENHTRNMFYHENLGVLIHILKASGFQVRLGAFDSSWEEQKTISLASGTTLTIERIERKGNHVYLPNFIPCAILLNNDLSTGVPELLQGISQPILPPLTLGWSTRLKSQHFSHYQTICEEFSQLFSIDSWLITPYFDQCSEVDFMNQTGQTCLIERARLLFEKIKIKYRDYRIDQPPFIIVKADAGTYGMGVMTIKDPNELAHLNRKQRTKMSTTKGGVEIKQAILQEGVYSFETWGKETAVAEPVVYMIGKHVVGGFYRVHKNKGVDENLNAPGMNFYPLAFSESCCGLPPSHEERVNRFYAYGVIARLAFLAAAREQTGLL